MDICIQGCANVWESDELLDILDNLIGTQIKRTNNVVSIDDIALQQRIDRKVKAKLALRKKDNHDEQYTCQHGG